MPRRPGSDLLSPFQPPMPLDNTTFEKHYRVGDLAELWGLGRETVRKIVSNETGVVKIRMGPKKAHTTYSVPESVAQRIHARLLNGVSEARRA